MNLNLPEKWNDILREVVESEAFNELDHFVEVQYQNKQVFPPRELVFKALEHCNPNNVKVVILGQDPYHSLHAANGLAFSVPLGIKHPPSLVNIFRELETDLSTAYPIQGELDSWAKQGVLLLNTALTVESAKPNSHQKQWSFFTDAVISKLSKEREGIVFLLWGGFAQKKLKYIDENKHCVLRSGHPSPLSANKGHWFGNKHFSKANQYLKNKGKSVIDWSL